MTRRSSQRALAQEIYREMKEERAKQEAAPTADPPSPDGFGGHGPSGQTLTAKARALYEHSAVPVAEIARLAGVTERTIYKYAARENWTPRYRWSAEGGRPRGARWRSRAALAPAKGAAGRFIRRADKGKPFATGLKAADPQAAARAGVACGEAARLARVAEVEAKIAALDKDMADTWKMTHRFTDDLVAYHQDHVRRYGRAPPPDDVVARSYADTLSDQFAWLREMFAEIMALSAEARRAEKGS